jgi:hypothetical protein
MGWRLTSRSSRRPVPDQWNIWGWKEYTNGDQADLPALPQPKVCEREDFIIRGRRRLLSGFRRARTGP